MNSAYTLNINGRLVSCHTPQVMGILNITPDSFYAGSRVTQLGELVERATQMAEQGALFIDVGAQSTRPQATLLTANQEWERLQPCLATLVAALPQVIFSIDTFHAQVAARAVDAGVQMVNDVSGGLQDADMLTTVARLRVPFVCMHSRGHAQNMQQQTQYEQVTAGVIDELALRLHQCNLAGIKDVLIDPGFGFAKNQEQNFELLQNLQALHILQRPLLVGLSRKSMVYKPLGVTATEALAGTTVLQTIALQKGAAILRVHDVQPAVQTIQLLGLLPGKYSE